MTPGSEPPVPEPHKPVPEQPRPPSDSTQEVSDGEIGQIVPPPPPTVSQGDDDGDLSGGKLGDHEKQLLEEQLTALKSRRRMRAAAFYLLLGTCILLFLGAGLTLTKLFSGGRIIAVLARSSEWHYLPLLSIAIVALTALPLSIAHGLMRMATSEYEVRKKKAKAAKSGEIDVEAQNIVLPQAEFLKALTIALFKRAGKSEID